MGFCHNFSLEVILFSSSMNGPIYIIYFGHVILVPNNDRAELRSKKVSVCGYVNNVLFSYES